MRYEDLVTQLTYTPQSNGEVPSAENLVIGGMGGSALAADALMYLTKAHDVRMHRDYGLPEHSPADALYVAISYSGNTEETLHFAECALQKNYPLAVVTSGGRLLQFAKLYNLPYVLVPEGIVPRNAFMYLVRGLLTLLGEKELLKEIASVRPTEDMLREAAEEDAHFLVHGIPLIYSSRQNECIGRLATCILNESARTPAFHNVFSELNHNEMQAFDRDMPDGLASLFRFVLVRDESDDPRIARRMQVFEKLMRDRMHVCHSIHIPRGKRTEALVHIWIRLLLAAHQLAETRFIDPDTQPLVDEFKTLL